MKALRKRYDCLIIFIALLILISPDLKSQSAVKPPPPPPPPPPPQAASTPGPSARADSLLLSGNLLSAVTEYEKLLPRYKDDRTVVYNYACALSLAGKADSSLFFLSELTKINPEISILTDPQLLAVRESPGWVKFEDELITAFNKKTGNSIKDIQYAKSLLRLLCLDQYLFYETGIAARNLGPYSPVVTALRRFQSVQIEKNLGELQALIDSKGCPEKSQVGNEAASAAFFVIQHSNARTQEKYISFFEAACRKGEGNWQQYALMFDRMRMNQNRPQRFGTHYYLDPSKGRTDELYPLEDESKVDEWRKEIGLEPLSEYLKRMNIHYKSPEK